MKLLYTFIADTKTLHHNFNMSEIMSEKPRPADYLHFTVKTPAEHEGKRALLFHASEYGTLPAGSIEALRKHGAETDMIFCCFPKEVRRVFQDKRVVGNWSLPTMFTLQITDEIAIIQFGLED